MRIVDVAAFYTPFGGGVKTYIDRKLAAGPLAGHEIIVVAPGPEDLVEERGPGARLIYLKAPSFPLDRRYHYFRDVAALHATLDALAPDFVEASSPWRSARLVGEWPGPAPRALVMHADPLSAYAYRWFDRVASRPMIDRGFGMFWRHLLYLDELFEASITTGEDQTARLLAGGMVNVVTNPMGVEPGVFSPDLRDEGLRARLLERCNLPPEATLLLGAGRHGPEKRWPMVIEAVTAAGVAAPVGLVLAGDGRERARVARAAADNPHIHLIAPVTDRHEVARLFASADALVHGCEAEVFCTVGGEARASGIPVIMPDRGGGADHARLSGGWLYASADPVALTQAIAAFIAAPRAKVRARAVERAPAVRTIDEHFHDLFADYESIVQKSRRVPARSAASPVSQEHAPLVGAVEMGGTKINLAIGTGPEDIRAEAILPTTDPDSTLAAIIAFLRAHPGLAAIGISAFGPVCLDRGAVNWGHITATTKSGWSDTPVATVIGDALALPVAFDTDVNGAALGEHRWGALAGTGVGLYLTVGTGIGGGVVIDGKALHGRVHPEMGHIRLKRNAGDDFAGLCPFHGDCLEGLASGPAIAARLGHALNEAPRDDPGRAHIIDALGQGVASLALTLSPDRIVMGGGVAKSPAFHADVETSARRWLGSYLDIPAGFVAPPALGDRAGVCGSIALAQDMLA